MLSYHEHYQISVSLKQRDVWERLGWYVYAYIDKNTGIIKYIGKGKDTRAWHHIDTKVGFTEDEIMILAYDLSNEGSAYDFEASKIAEHKEKYGDLPEWNVASGHHEERFVMQSYAQFYNMVTENVSSAYDYIQLPWVLEFNTDKKVFTDKTTNKFEVKSDNTIVHSASNRDTGYRIELDVDHNGILNTTNEIAITLKFSENKLFQENINKAVAWLQTELDESQIVVQGDKIGIKNVDLNFAMSLYKATFSIEV